MNARQFQQFESIIACEAILQHREFRTREIDALRVKLEGAIALVRQLFHAQTAEDMSRKGGTAGLKALRKNVRKRLMRLSRLAVVELDGLPGIREEVRLPPGNAKDADLVKATMKILKNLRPHVKTLYAGGLPDDAITRLEAAAKSLKARAADPETPIARRSRATASLPSAIRRAREIARALDTAIKSDLSDYAINMWKTVYRIPRKRGRPKKPRRQDPE
jgi:hypothetical protein